MAEPFWNSTETWTTREGEVLRLEDMEPSHQRNVIEWLRRHVLQIRARMNMALILTGLQFVSEPHGEMAEDSFLTDFEERSDFIDDATDDELLESLPLVKRLRELLGEVPGPESAESRRQRFVQMEAFEERMSKLPRAEH